MRSTPLFITPPVARARGWCSSFHSVVRVLAPRGAYPGYRRGRLRSRLTRSATRPLPA